MIPFELIFIDLSASLKDADNNAPLLAWRV